MLPASKLRAGRALFFGLLCGTAFAGHGQAQTVPAPASTAEVEAGYLDEIVVTARKRSESIQDVPISVTAVSSAMIERNNMAKIDQVAAVTPNVEFKNVSVDPTGFAAYIRGVGSRSQEPQELAIALSIDGVYLTDGAGALVDLFDLQQIEILRGPQGILQGRNAPGGAVNITTRRPSGGFGGRAAVSYERFDLVRVNAAVEAPIVKDVIAARVSAYYNDGGAFMKNVHTGGRAAGIRNWGGRIGVLFTPSETFTAYLTADYVRDTSQQVALRPVPHAGPRGPREPEPAVCFGYGFCTPFGKYETGYNFTDRMSSKNGGVGLNMDWELGPVTLTSVSGYRYVNEIQRNDVDAVPATVLHSPNQRRKIRAWSQEVRLASNGAGPLRYVIGAYAIKATIDLLGNLEIGSKAVRIPGPEFTIKRSSARAYDSKSYAVFGQASYQITDQWSISAGARQTWDKKDVTSQPNLALPPVARLKPKFKNLSLEAGTEYKITPDMLAYFRFAQGYRSGGVNADVTNVLAINVFEPEEVDSYEIGLKTEWFDRRLTANLSAFQYDFTNIQFTAVDLTPGGTLQRVVNGKGLKIKGAEFEMHFRPDERLTVNGALGYLHTKYQSQIANLGFGPTDLAELRKENAPKLTAYLAVDYAIPVGPEGGKVVVGGDVRYKSMFFTNPINNPVGRQEPYALVGAAVTYRAPDDRYTIGVYGENLTDKYYKTGAEASGGFLLWHVVGRPRTYGVRASATF